MPKTIVLGILGSVAICSIVIGGRRSDAPPQSDALLAFVGPISTVTSNKSDRLPTLVESAVALPKQITEVSFVAVQQEPRPASPIIWPKPSPDFVPRHWHDPYASQPEAKKLASSAKKSARRPAEKRLASVAKECSTDGFAPLLRKLRLAADCET